MNDEQKKQYTEKYYQEKQKGVKFWPDIIYKDLVITLGVFILLVLLAYALGVSPEPKADPADSSYIPRPEWYFLWLFEFLKYIPGDLEWVGATVVPGALVALLFLLPFIDRNPRRHWKQRPVAIAVMSFIVLAIVALTVISTLSTPAQAEGEVVASTIPEKIAAGDELFATYCTECHGADGDVTTIEGVEGLEGKIISPIKSTDVMYAFTDDTLKNIVAMGMQDQGMPPFGKAYGGELSPGELENIVTFMRYTWDNRVELPAEAAATGKIPALTEGETPTWDKHIQPLFKRYCGSCHREGKKNNNFLVQTYELVINSGDNAPNLVAGDLNSNLVRMINREDLGDIGGVMPPTKALPDDLIQMLEQWVLAGMPQGAAEAGNNPPAVVPNASATGTATPTASPTAAATSDTKPQVEGTATPQPPSPTPEATATPEAPSPTPEAPPAEPPTATIEIPTPTVPPSPTPGVPTQPSTPYP